MVQERTQKSKSKGNGQGTVYFSKTKNIWVGQYTLNGKRKNSWEEKNKMQHYLKKKLKKLKNKFKMEIKYKN